MNVGENLKLFVGSENFKCDFVYVGDVVVVNLWFLDYGVFGIFNCGIGKVELFNEVVKVVIVFYGCGEVEIILFLDYFKGVY